jgi:hypothetical protein
MVRRVIHWGEDHAFIVTMVLFSIIIIAGISAVSVQTDRDVREAKTRAAALVQEAKNRAVALAEANTETCKRAVIAVTNQGKADDLKILETIKERFAENGRPVPAIYLALEAEVSNRQPPVAACEPKENP